jgi:ATP phosphoribosyltransferase regulatory subunit
MEDALHPALLPAGLRDILPPDAEFEAGLVERLMESLRLHGFERVKPPLIEFETSLLGGAGVAMAPETFRLMDPISQRMIGVRADMTLQVARIATTRLAKSPRPLRLSYAGQVLRVSGAQLRKERQLGQVGAELIGSDEATADAEMIVLAAEALECVGVPGLSVDLTLPTLVPLILAGLGVEAATAALLRQALDRKDAASLDRIDGAASILSPLMAAAGPAARALERIARIALPPAAAREIDQLHAILDLVGNAAPNLALTIDPVENRGFEYHTGVSFTLFARGIHGELGRGGRYLAGGAAEPATGFTLYTDTVIRAVPPAVPGRRIYLPHRTSREIGVALRSEGWATVAGLAAVEDAVGEARRLGCGHMWVEGAVAVI